MICSIGIAPFMVKYKIRAKHTQELIGREENRELCFQTHLYQLLINLINCHKNSGLRHKFINLQFWRSTVQHSSQGASSFYPFRRFRGKSMFYLCLTSRGKLHSSVVPLQSLETAIASLAFPISHYSDTESSTFSFYMHRTLLLLGPPG